MKNERSSGDQNVLMRKLSVITPLPSRDTAASTPTTAARALPEPGSGVDGTATA